MWLFDEAGNVDRQVQFFDTAEVVTTFGQYTIMKHITPLSIYYGVFNNAALVAYYVLSKHEGLSNVYRSYHIYVREEYRGQGIATFLYRYVVLNERLVLISDRYQTPEGSKMWERMRQQPDIQVGMLDEITNEIKWDYDNSVVYGNDHIHFIARPR